MAQTRVIAQNRNFYTDGRKSCLVQKTECTYRVLYFTGKSCVETVYFPSKTSAMDAVRYYLDEQKMRRVYA